MSSPITNNPRGLVSLLGLRDMGEAPRLVADAIAPTIDVTQFLLLNREVVTETWQASIPGPLLGPTVPPGELWYIHTFSVRSRTLVGVEEIRLTPLLAFQGRNFAVGLPSARATTNQIATSYQDKPGWLGPGAALALMTEAIVTGGVIDVFGEAVITRLRI